MSATETDTNTAVPPCSPPSVVTIFICFAKMTLVSFGGGLTAWSRQILVAEKGWLTDEEFLETLSLSQTLPGAINANLAVIVGRKLKGMPGAISAILGLTLPAMIILAILVSLYISFNTNPAVDKALDGVTCACAGLSAATAYHLGRKHFKKPMSLFFVIVTLILVGVLRFSLIPVLLSLGPLSALYVWFAGRRKTFPEKI